MRKALCSLTVPVLAAILLLAAGPSMPAAGAAGGGDLERPPVIHLKWGSFDPLAGVPAVPPRLAAAPGDDVRLLQVRRPLASEEIGLLEESGATLLGYVPEFTYLARIPAGSLAAIRALPLVRWVGDFHPAYKIQEGLLESSEDEVEVNVLFFSPLLEGAPAGALGEALVASGATITYEEMEGFPLVRVRVSPRALPDLAALPAVRWIERLEPKRADMNNVRTATGGATAHTAGFDGTGIVGEVKDNGIDQSHPDFGNLIGTYGSPVVDSHGTCTFGIVFGDGTGSTTALGMMPGGGGVFCDWYVSRSSSIQNLKNSWSGVFQSNSWSEGTTDGDYTSLSQEDDQAIVTHDVMMFHSASNSNYGVGATTISRDSAAKNVVCVGAVYHMNTASLADDAWQNYGPGSTPSQGPAADGRIKPDLCGFFDWIYTTDEVGSAGYSSNNYYNDFGGTSGACPIVAGAAGLAYDMYKANHFANNPSGATPHAATIKALLIANAYQYTLAQATRYQQGWGLPDLGRIHASAANQTILDGGVPLSTGQTWSTVVARLSASDPLKISLVWSDEPGEASASKALINDLDLQVTAPDATVYRGNVGLVSALWSSSGGSADRTNNVENVFIQSPQAGNYTIQVSAYNVALDNDPAAGVNQAFSLVASRTGSAGPVETMHVVLGCVPASGTLPYTLQVWPQLFNETDYTRTLFGRINVRIADGTNYNNWRSGFTNVGAQSSFTTTFNVALPDFPALVGNNIFTLYGADITASPFNQPPYPTSGDTDTQACTTVGN